MHILDIVTIVLGVFLLIIVGFTIYAYVKRSSYSHYALAISIAGVLGLAYFTRSTDDETYKDYYGHLKPSRQLRLKRKFTKADEYPEDALNVI
jgi:hypothetical protein